MTAHSIEAEQSLLGAMMLNNEVLARVGTIVAEEHFFDPIHRIIFARCKDKIERGVLASPVTIFAAMSSEPGLEQLGGAGYLARLAGAAVSIGDAKYYAAVIRDAYLSRQTGVVTEAAQESLAGGASPQDVLSRLSMDIADLASSASDKPLVRSFRFAVGDALESIGAAYQRGDGLAGLSTGLVDLDKKIGGLAGSQSIIIAGRTSMGKTALGWSIATHNAEQGNGVLFASLEMAGRELANRYISRALLRQKIRLPYDTIRKGDMTEDQARAVWATSKQLLDMPIELAESECRDMGKLRAAILRARSKMEKAGTPLRLIVIDYVQLIDVPKARMKAEAVDIASKFCKAIAKDLDLPVILLAQISREAESDRAGSRRPQLSHLKWSGALEEDADTALLLYRPEYYHEREKPERGASEKDWQGWAAAYERDKKRVEIIVAKNKTGSIGSVFAHCEIEFDLIQDLVPEQETLL